VQGVNAEMDSEFGFGGQGASPQAIEFYTKALEALATSRWACRES